MPSAGEIVSDVAEPDRARVPFTREQIATLFIHRSLLSTLTLKIAERERERGGQRERERNRKRQKDRDRDRDRQTETLDIRSLFVYTTDTEICLFTAYTEYA